MNRLPVTDRTCDVILLAGNLYLVTIFLLRFATTSGTNLKLHNKGSNN